MPPYTLQTSSLMVKGDWQPAEETIMFGFGDWTQKERIERWNISVQWQSTRRQSMLYDGLLEGMF